MSVEGVFDEMERRLLEAQDKHFAAQRAVMQAEGIAGIINVGEHGSLWAQGPGVHGSVVLFAMEDGTVRWKRP